MRPLSPSVAVTVAAGVAAAAAFRLPSCSSPAPIVHPAIRKTTAAAFGPTFSLPRRSSVSAGGRRGWIGRTTTARGGHRRQCRGRRDQPFSVVRLFLAYDDGDGGAAAADDDDDDDVEEGGDVRPRTEAEDWRSFRARLVASRAAAGSSSSPPSSSSGDSGATGDAIGGGRWTYDAGSNVEVGTVLLSVPTPDLCQGLEQQWFHRCVCLVTHRSSPDGGGGAVAFVGGGRRDDRVDGEESEGEVYATRAVLLNRPARLPLAPTGEEGGSGGDVRESDVWNAWFGGDIRGPFSSLDDYKQDDDDDDDNKESNGSASSEAEGGYGMEVLCLHSLSTSAARSVSSLLLPGPSSDSGSGSGNGDLYSIALNDAQRLVADGEAELDDFFPLSGYCAWTVGQLEREMGPARGEWYAVSADGASVAEELRRQREGMENREGGGADDGFDMWERFVHRISRSEEATSGVSPGQLQFYDGMLRAWTGENLPLALDMDDDIEEEAVLEAETAIAAEIGPGMLVRASSPTSSHAPYLLEEQEFHRSLVLILTDDDRHTVGLMLNLPLAGVVELAEGVELPIRYGGPGDIYDLEGEDALQVSGETEEERGGGDWVGEDAMLVGDAAVDEWEGQNEGVEAAEPEPLRERAVRWDMGPDDPFLFLHRSSSLLWKGVGTPLDHRSGVCTLSGDDAARALRTNLARPEELLLISGFCVWAKGEEIGEIGGGIAEQLAIGNFQVVESNEAMGEVWENVWDALVQQRVLRAETLCGNVEKAIAAWRAASDSSGDEEKETEDGLVALADSALKAWVAVEMLGDPTLSVTTE